jgi:serine/threonine-protein kinase
MSPEQARGFPVDHRSDIYSTGVVLYELFTGSLPFEGDSPLAVVLKHVNDPAPHPRSKNPWIDPRIATILMKCLEKDPGARFQSMGELYVALAKVTVRQAAGAGKRAKENENGNRVNRALQFAQ